MVKIEIDPVTRIEGHLSVTVNVENGKVTEAYTHSTMFRGVEIFLVGRDPRDAPHFTQRVCGVCFEVHRLTSLRAIEDAAGLTIPDGARKLRNIYQGIFHLWNHAVHLYALAGPDYSDAVAKTGLKRLDPLAGKGYLEAVVNQRKLLQAFAVIGGKAPHPLTPVPGGFSNAPSVEKIMQMKTMILEVSSWLGATENVPAVIDNVVNGKFDPELGSGLHDIVGLLLAAKEAGADTWGLGPGRFYAHGFYDLPDGGLFFPRGTFDGGKINPLDEKNVVEHVTRSWYSDESGGMYVGDAPPPEPKYGKSGAYSWAKAPRYEGKSMEVGPLARMIMKESDPFDLRKALTGGSTKSSTLGRLIARAQEALLIRDALVTWLDELVPGEKVYTNYEIPDSGFGVGLWEATRGSIGHWVNVKNKKIDRYQIITPTAWNLGPRDNKGQPSPMEQALVGVPVPDIKNPINVLRTIRSFDPCLACTVHIQTPHGKKYTISTSPAEVVR